MLSDNDIRLIKGMLIRGDRQSDIAAWFADNSGRIAEINTGKRGNGIRPALPHELPPPGPYRMSLRTGFKAKQTLEAMRELITDVLNDIEKWDRD